MPGTFLNTLYKFISYNLYNESNEVQFNFKFISYNLYNESNEVQFNFK